MHHCALFVSLSLFWLGKIVHDLCRYLYEPYFREVYIHPLYTSCIHLHNYIYTWIELRAIPSEIATQVMNWFTVTLQLKTKTKKSTASTHFPLSPLVKLFCCWRTRRGACTCLPFSMWCARTSSFISVTWLIHMCDMNHSYTCHDSCIFMTWLIEARDTPQHTATHCNTLQHCNESSTGGSSVTEWWLDKKQHTRHNWVWKSPQMKIHNVWVKLHCIIYTFSSSRDSMLVHKFASKFWVFEVELIDCQAKSYSNNGVTPKLPSEVAQCL